MPSFCSHFGKLELQAIGFIYILSNGIERLRTSVTNFDCSDRFKQMAIRASRKISTVALKRLSLMTLRFTRVPLVGYAKGLRDLTATLGDIHIKIRSSWLLDNRLSENCCIIVLFSLTWQYLVWWHFSNHTLHKVFQGRDSSWRIN